MPNKKRVEFRRQNVQVRVGYLTIVFYYTVCYVYAFDAPWQIPSFLHDDYFVESCLISSYLDVTY